MKTGMKLSKKLKDEIIAYIDENQPSVYWDYNDELSIETIEEMLDSEDGIGYLNDHIWDMNHSYIFELTREILEECMDDFEDKVNEYLGMERGEWEDTFIEFFSEYVSVDLDLDGLISNTGDEVFFYDTGLELGDSSFADDDEVAESVKEIKETLSITGDEFDSDLRMMVLQASYGGNLVVYFKTDIKTILKMKEQENKNINFFGGVSIAIIDTGGGSGDDMEIQHSFELPFSPENIYFERGIKYNYSFAVCGMCDDWCKDTSFELVERSEEQEVEIHSSLRTELERDKALTKKWRTTGKCTFGDMDYSRHKRRSYTNSFPAGHTCSECGTFWID